MGWFSTIAAIVNGESRMSAMEAKGTAFDTANAIQYVVPTTGQTINATGTGSLVLAPAGLLATLTVTFPSSPVDGQGFEVFSSQIITALTLSGGTIKGAITSIAINGWARWKYSSTGAAWFRAS
jgi:hypothetical protein